MHSLSVIVNISMDDCGTVSIVFLPSPLYPPCHEELEFERGLWQAAKDGDKERVKRLLGDGSAVNATDSAGYTALVCHTTP